MSISNTCNSVDSTTGRRPGIVVDRSGCCPAADLREYAYAFLRSITLSGCTRNLPAGRQPEHVNETCPKREWECFSGLALHTAEHPLLSQRSSYCTSPTELTVVDFDSNVKIADLLRVAQHVGQTWPLNGIGSNLWWFRSQTDPLVGQCGQESGERCRTWETKPQWNLRMCIKP